MEQNEGHEAVFFPQCARTCSSQTSRKNVSKQNFCTVVNRISFIFKLKSCGHRVRLGENIPVELSFKKISQYYVGICVYGTTFNKYIAVPSYSKAINSTWIGLRTLTALAEIRKEVKFNQACYVTWFGLYAQDITQDKGGIVNNLASELLLRSGCSA